jgi:hypothetical protein
MTRGLSTILADFYFVISKTKLTLEGPKDAQGTTFAKPGPGFVKSQTPVGKMFLKRLRSLALIVGL